MQWTNSLATSTNVSHDIVARDLTAVAGASIPETTKSSFKFARTSHVTNSVLQGDCLLLFESVPLPMRSKPQLTCA